MFAPLFRSTRIAPLAIIPNLVASGLVLDVLGWLQTPLDIMTIAIAALTLRTGVDDTIHYIHRYLEEDRGGGDHRAAIQCSHASIGRAMLYMSMTIAFAFSILVCRASSRPHYSACSRRWR